MKAANTIVFVCEHGAAKSIVAAAHFNRLAEANGLIQRAVARGTHPDAKLSEAAVAGLSGEGLSPTERAPEELTSQDLETAQRIIAFCELPAKFRQYPGNERWEGIPAVSTDYAGSRDALLARLRSLIADISPEA